MNKVLISRWADKSTRYRMKRDGDLLVFEIVEGYGRDEMATDKFSVPFKDFLADVEMLK